MRMMESGDLEEGGGEGGGAERGRRGREDDSSGLGWISTRCVDTMTWESEDIA